MLSSLCLSLFTYKKKLCLSLSQNHRIRGLLEKCTLDHESRMETLHDEIRERALSDAKWRQIQQDSNQSVSATIKKDHLVLI